MAKALKILSRPKGNAEEYGRWSVNPYIGCSHGCLYCYLKKGPSGAYLGQDAPVLKTGVVNDEHAYHLAMAEIIEHRDEIIRDGGLFMTFTSDPCAWETHELFSKISHESVKRAIPVTVLTKSTSFMNTYSYERFRGAFMGYTLTGHDELEPNAAPTEFRIDALKELNKDGFHTWASIEPVINFPSSLDMIYQALNAGCQHFKIGLLTNNTRLVRKDFEFGEHHFDAYKVNDCLHFVEDVMRMTAGKATVYWKQSVRDLFDGDGHIILDQWTHSVGKNWNMFSNE